MQASPVLQAPKVGVLSEACIPVHQATVFKDLKLRLLPDDLILFHCIRSIFNLRSYFR
jgi:hypothetical protein